MLRNKRGEVITVTLVMVAIVTMLVGFFARPVANKLLPGVLGTDQRITSTKVIESKPVWMPSPDGKTATLVQSTTTTYDENNKPVPLTFFQKLTQFGVISIIILLLIVLTPLGGIFIWLWSRLKTLIAKHEELKTETVKIVQSVNAGRAVLDQPTKDKMSVVMDGAQNDSTKKLVEDIKMNGTITKE